MRPFDFSLTIICTLAIVGGLVPSGVLAADRFFGYNQTTATVFTGAYLAAEGTTAWGPNEALNDKDKSWEPGERLLFKSASRGRFDLKIVERSGRVCVTHGVDLTKDPTFELRDADLSDCSK